MKSRMMLSMLVIALVAAVIGGGTMAYFSYKVEVDNEFTAGTVTITAEENVELTHDLDNVNPGDCLEKVIEICNVGSKDVVLRMRNAGEWVYTTAWRDYLRDNWDELCYSDDPKPTDREGWDAIIADMNEIDIVGFVPEGWEGPDEDGWYYSPASYDGDYDEQTGECVDAIIEVCFDGPGMTNYWQKARYTMVTEIQALQASNFAPYHVWGVDYYGEPTED